MRAETDRRPLPEQADLDPVFEAEGRRLELLPARTPRRFDISPYSDVERKRSLNARPHFCLGANLARAEIRLLFSELLARFPDIDVAGPVRRLRSATVDSIKSMPVRFTPTPGSGRHTT
jgi:hypothetical protein